MIELIFNIIWGVLLGVAFFKWISWKGRHKRLEKYHEEICDKIDEVASPITETYHALAPEEEALVMAFRVDSVSSKLETIKSKIKEYKELKDAIDEKFAKYSTSSPFLHTTTKFNWLMRDITRGGTKSSAEDDMSPLTIQDICKEIAEKINYNDIKVVQTAKQLKVYKPMKYPENEGEVIIDYDKKHTNDK